MSAFFCKKIPAPPQRICIRLKELRQQAGASLGEMATKTKIDKKYLQA